MGGLYSQFQVYLLCRTFLCRFCDVAYLGHCKFVLTKILERQEMFAIKVLLGIVINHEKNLVKGSNFEYFLADTNNSMFLLTQRGIKKH